MTLPPNASCAPGPVHESCVELPAWLERAISPLRHERVAKSEYISQTRPLRVVSWTHLLEWRRGMRWSSAKKDNSGSFLEPCCRGILVGVHWLAHEARCDACWQTWIPKKKQRKCLPWKYPPHLATSFPSVEEDTFGGIDNDWSIKILMKFVVPKSSSLVLKSVELPTLLTIS